MYLNSRGLLGRGFGKMASRQLGASGAPVPPGAPIHWWDGTDASQLYSDDEATTLIAGTDGNIIRAITDKGSNALTMTVEDGADTHVTFDAVWGSTGQSGINFDCVAAAPDMGMFTTTPGVDEATAGWTSICIWTTDDAESNTVKVVASAGDNASIIQILDDAWHSFSGGGKRHETNIVDNQVIGSIWDHKQSDTAYTSRHSGDDVILSGTETYSDFEAAGDEFKMGYNTATTVENMVIGEWILYAGNMADNGLADEDFITYIQDKYGIAFTAIS